MTTEQIRKPLPESLMKAITATAQSPELTPGEKLEAVVLVTHGYGLFTASAGSIDPTAYAIPVEQWNVISVMLQEAASGMEQVNVALEWMNIGPSGYKEEDADV